MTTNRPPSRAGATWGMLWGALFGLPFFVPVFGWRWERPSGRCSARRRAPASTRSSSAGSGHGATWHVGAIPDRGQGDRQARGFERLRLDAIDLYQIHWPIPDEDLEEGWSALVELKEQRLVRHIGVSNFDVEQLRRIQRIAPVETIQPPYSLVERDIFPFCMQEGIGVIVYSPMGSGLLTGRMTRERIESLPDDDWRKRDERFEEPNLSRSLALVERLKAVADRHEVTPGAIAVAWTLRHPAVDGAIVGFRRPEQVDPIVVAAGLELTDRDLDQIEGRQ